MHQQSTRQLQERLTSLAISTVLDDATRFFARGGGIYTVFLEKRGASHVAMRGQGGEELVIAARAVPEGTMVSGSSYLFDQQIAAFLDSLPVAAPRPPSDDALLPSAEQAALLPGTAR